MRFTAEGQIGGRTVYLAWEDGELTGPQAAVDYVKGIADDLTGAKLGHPEGPQTTRDYLDFWYSTFDVLARAFGPSLKIYGAPEGEPPPKGAVG